MITTSDSTHRPEPIDWRIIHKNLMVIARHRSELDAAEARWLREAEAQQIWKELGLPDVIAYMDHVLGCGPRFPEPLIQIHIDAGVGGQWRSYTAGGDVIGGEQALGLGLLLVAPAGDTGRHLLNWLRFRVSHGSAAPCTSRSPAVVRGRTTCSYRPEMMEGNRWSGRPSTWRMRITSRRWGFRCASDEPSGPATCAAALP